MGLINNKRGGLENIFLFIIFIVIIVFVSVIFVYMGNTVKTQLHLQLDNLTEAGSPVNYSKSIDIGMGGVTNAYGSLYWIAIVLIIGLVFAIFVHAYLVTFNPVWFASYVFLIITAIVVSVGISNAYEIVMVDETLGSTFQGFLMANFILLHLPIWVTIIGFVGGIIMVTKFRQEQAGFYGG